MITKFEDVDGYEGEKDYMRVYYCENQETAIGLFKSFPNLIITIENNLVYVSKKNVNEFEKQKNKMD